MASSAQCRSSQTSTVPGTALSAIAAAISYGFAPAASASSPTRPVMSANGPSGRAVNSGSQPPHSTLPQSSRNRRSSAVFPLPASPATTTSAPVPSSRTRRYASRSAASCGPRSSSAGSARVRTLTSPA